jgi:hypothetical protein
MVWQDSMFFPIGFGGVGIGFNLREWGLTFWFSRHFCGIRVLCFRFWIQYRPLEA